MNRRVPNNRHCSPDVSHSKNQLNCGHLLTCSPVCRFPASHSDAHDAGRFVRSNGDKPFGDSHRPTGAFYVGTR